MYLKPDLSAGQDITDNRAGGPPLGAKLGLDFWEASGPQLW